MAVCPNCHETNPEAGASCPRCEGFHYIPEDALEDAASDPMIGQKAADKYVILSLINEGGMGAVYRALQLPVEREVAFKVLRTELKDSDNGRDRFIREARAVSRLNHPNIITLYDFGFDDGRHPYMVMEYAPGKSLGKWLKTDDLTIDRILRVTAQILSALTEAHQHGIVHRDLKPENMIVTPKGNDYDRVKLLDFGIARLINEGNTRGLTREGEVFGTPHYMAPEQAQGKKSIGPPADVYALGIILWELICGECPFDAPTPLAVLFMHINDPLPPLQPRDGIDVPAGLWECMLHATAKDPKDRYQSASEMMNDISAIIISVTGTHPGALTGDMSAEYALGDTQASMPSGLVRERIQSATPLPSRAPHFTPTTDELGSGVDVHDPEASHLGLVEEPAVSPAATKKLGIIAAASVLAVVLMVGVLLALATSSDEANAEAKDESAEAITDSTEDRPTTEVAVKKEERSDDIQVEAIEVPPGEEEEEDNPDELETETAEREPKEAADAKTEPAARVDQKEKPKPKTKPTPKPKPTAEPKREAKPKPKPKPGKWQPATTPKEEPAKKKPVKWN